YRASMRRLPRRRTKERSARRSQAQAARTLAGDAHLRIGRPAWTQLTTKVKVLLSPLLQRNCAARALYDSVSSFRTAADCPSADSVILSDTRCNTEAIEGHAA